MIVPKILSDWLSNYLSSEIHMRYLALNILDYDVYIDNQELINYGILGVKLYQEGINKIYVSTDYFVYDWNVLYTNISCLRYPLISPIIVDYGHMGNKLLFQSIPSASLVDLKSYDIYTSDSYIPVCNLKIKESNIIFQEQLSLYEAKEILGRKNNYIFKNIYDEFDFYDEDDDFIYLFVSRYLLSVKLMNKLNSSSLALGFKIYNNNISEQWFKDYLNKISSIFEKADKDEKISNELKNKIVLKIYIDILDKCKPICENINNLKISDYFSNVLLYYT